MAQADSNRRRTGSAKVPALRRELDQLRAGLDRLDAALAELEELEKSGGPARPRPERYYLLLVDVYERGRLGVQREDLAALGRRRGYDARGLGGFFVGSRAPLRREGQRVVLSTAGHRLLDDYLPRAVQQ